MNHKEKLLEIYKRSCLVTKVEDLDAETQKYIDIIGEKTSTQKGVFTVLVTLLTHKIIDPKQDIRKHQASMEGGFSARTIDTRFITPTLKELGLPSMSESGWLTRSLEQPYPYNLGYDGKISDKNVKNAFLNVLDFVEKNPTSAENMLIALLVKAIQSKNNSIVTITPLEDPEKLTIENIIESLVEHFGTNYHTHGGAKLPALAFFALYKSLINEVKRYEGCSLPEMGSHTASDRTSNSAGDIEIFKDNGTLFEAVEIKLDKPIDANMVRIAIEKASRHNPERYYILSNKKIQDSDKTEIDTLIKEFKISHGCQIIINGILPTIKYYLRLISSLDDFVSIYSELIKNDSEIKTIHKEMWNTLISKYLN